jgi:hypothetical protein
MLAAVQLDGLFGDVVYFAMTVAFFALAWLLVRLCERISGFSDVAAVTEVEGVDPMTGTRAA